MTPHRSRFALASTAFALAAILGGCAVSSPSQPDAAPSVSVDPGFAGKVRAPDATGTILALPMGDDSISIAFEPDAGFEYFAGTTFDVPLGAFPHGEDGVSLSPENLAVGDHINVWVGVCRESQPVQCDVERVELAP